MSTLPTASVAIEIASALGIEAKEFSRYLLVRIGDQIKPNQILASKKKSPLSFSNIEVRSPIAGTILQIDEIAGLLILEESQVPVTELQEPKLQTQVLPLSPENEPILPTLHPSMPTEGVLFGFGKASGTGIWMSGNLDPATVTVNLKNKIILLGALPTRHGMFKASAVGVEGIIVATDEPLNMQIFKTEMGGSTQIGCLVVGAKFPLKTLDGQKLAFDGDTLKLEVGKAQVA